MRRNEALPSQYLGKDDVPKPALVTIESLGIETIKTDRGEEEKPVMHFKELDRGLIINVTNWDACEDLFKKDDSDEWVGNKVVLYVDPDVRFAGKKVGGLRLRGPRTPAAKASPEPEESEEPEVPF